MQLNKDFVRQLNPSLSDRLRHGDQQRIAEAVGLTPLSVRNAVTGSTTNEVVVKAAIRTIIEDSQRTDRFLEQIPQEILNEIIYSD